MGIFLVEYAHFIVSVGIKKPLVVYYIFFRSVLSESVFFKDEFLKNITLPIFAFSFSKGFKLEPPLVYLNDKILRVDFFW